MKKKPPNKTDCTQKEYKRTQKGVKLTEIYHGWSEITIFKEKNGRLHIAFAIEDDKEFAKQF